MIKQWLTQHGEKDHETGRDLYNTPAPDPCRSKQPDVLPALVFQVVSMLEEKSDLWRHSDENFGIDTHTETVEPVPVPNSPSRRMPIPWCFHRASFLVLCSWQNMKRRTNMGARKYLPAIQCLYSGYELEVESHLQDEQQLCKMLWTVQETHC